MLSYTRQRHGDAGAGSDYTPLSGTVTIPAGATTADIDVSVLDDHRGGRHRDRDRDAGRHHQSVPRHQRGRRQQSATVSIADDDTATVSIAKISDGAEAATPDAGKFRLTQTKASSTDTVLSYTVGGTATPGAGNDYSPLGGTATIPAGATTADIDVTVLNDNLVEATETVIVTLASITSGDPQITISAANPTATVTISSDDVATISIGAAVPRTKATPEPERSSSWSRFPPRSMCPSR